MLGGSPPSGDAAMDGLLNLIAAIKDPAIFEQRIAAIKAAQQEHDLAAEAAAKSQAEANDAHQQLLIREKAIEERAAAVNRQADANAKRLADLDLSNKQLQADIEHHALDHLRRSQMLDEREASLKIREGAIGAKESELQKREAAVAPREQAANKKAAQAETIIERARALTVP
jgi:hypothetical protein